MVFGRIGTDCHHDISVSDIVPVIGHGTAAERFRQTGDSGGMSYAGMMFDVHQTQGTCQLYQQVAFFIVQG